MSWQKQMEDIVSGWTETQQRMWDNWMEALRTLDYSDQADAWQRQYQQSLEAWEHAVQEALARQQAWARSWSGTAAEDAPPGAAADQWAGQMQEMMTVWTESQRRFWEAWLEQSRTAGGGNEGWGQGLEAVAAAWEDAARRSQQAMTEWSRMTATAADSRSAPRGGGAGGSPSGGSSGRSAGGAGTKKKKKKND